MVQFCAESFQTKNLSLKALYSATNKVLFCSDKKPTNQRSNKTCDV